MSTFSFFFLKTHTQIHKTLKTKQIKTKYEVIENYA